MKISSPTITRIANLTPDGVVTASGSDGTLGTDDSIVGAPCDPPARYDTTSITFTVPDTYYEINASISSDVYVIIITPPTTSTPVCTIGIGSSGSEVPILSIKATSLTTPLVIPLYIQAGSRVAIKGDTSGATLSILLGYKS